MVRISPMRRCSPTRTTSAILASSKPVATTSGPETLTIFPWGVFFLSSDDIRADCALHCCFYLLHSQAETALLPGMRIMAGVADLR